MWKLTKSKYLARFFRATVIDALGTFYKYARVAVAGVLLRVRSWEQEDEGRCIVAWVLSKQASNEAFGKLAKLRHISIEQPIHAFLQLRDLKDYETEILESTMTF